MLMCFMAHIRKRKNLVGPQVRRIRVHGALAQSELAARCQRQGWDIDRNTIAKIEGGARWVKDYELFELARALRVPVGRLLGLKPE